MSKIKPGIPIKYNQDSIFAKLQMRILKRKAKNMLIKTGRQQHIIPSGANHVMIVDNRWRKALNKYGKTNKLSYIRLIQIAFYSTKQSRRVI